MKHNEQPNNASDQTWCSLLYLIKSFITVFLHFMMLLLLFSFYKLYTFHLHYLISWFHFPKTIIADIKSTSTSSIFSNRKKLEPDRWRFIEFSTPYIQIWFYPSHHRDLWFWPWLLLSLYSKQWNQTPPLFSPLHLVFNWILLATQGFLFIWLRNTFAKPLKIKEIKFRADTLTKFFNFNKSRKFN